MAKSGRKAEKKDSTITIRALKTRGAAAKHFGVHSRTVAEWLTDPTFPGKAGTRGKQDGHFPIDAIGEWLRLRERNEDEADAEESEGGQLNSEIKREKLRKLKLANDETEGRLIDADSVRRLFTRSHALANQMLYQLVAAVPACLPTGAGAAAKQEVRRAVQRALDEVSGQLAAAIKELGE